MAQTGHIDDLAQLLLGGNSTVGNPVQERRTTPQCKTGKSAHHRACHPVRMIGGRSGDAAFAQEGDLGGADNELGDVGIQSRHAAQHIIGQLRIGSGYF